MGGERLQEYWRQEVQALEAAYRQFETLIPAEERKGAAHPGEDGRYVECLLTEALKRFLPRNIEIFSGFILRPGVKSGVSKAARASDSDQHSGQLDLIVYDSANYPVFQRFGDHAVVPPEGVIAVLSVKKICIWRMQNRNCWRCKGPESYARKRLENAAHFWRWFPWEAKRKMT